MNKVLRSVIHGLIMVTIVFFSILPLKDSSAWANTSILVEVIQASQSESSFVSSNLLKIEKRLSATFKTFNRFESVSAKRFSLSLDGEQLFHITDGLDVILKLLKQREREIDLVVKIPKRSVKHTVKAKLGRLFFEAIKWRGKVYLIAIRPQ